MRNAGPSRAWIHSRGVAAWPLVGRSSEQSRLLAALVERRGAVVVGAAGVGKTTLVTTCLQIAQERGWRSPRRPPPEPRGACPSGRSPRSCPPIRVRPASYGAATASCCATMHVRWSRVHRGARSWCSSTTPISLTTARRRCSTSSPSPARRPCSRPCSRASPCRTRWLLYGRTARPSASRSRSSRTGSSPSCSSRRWEDRSTRRRFASSPTGARAIPWSCGNS